MKFHLQRDGQSLGTFTIEELRVQREGHGLTGAEYAWRQGMNNWVQLDTLLAQDATGNLPAAAPALSASARDPTNRGVYWAVFGAVVLVVVFLGFVGFRVSREVRRVLPVVRQQLSPVSGQIPSAAPRPDALRIASQPVVWTDKTKTVADAKKRAYDFRRRVWVEDYELRGRRDASCYADALKFLEIWTKRQYGLEVPADLPADAEWGDKLTAAPDCDDPLVLAAIGVMSADHHAGFERLMRAVQGFHSSKHLAYAKFYANVQLANRSSDQPHRAAQLEVAARPFFKQLFSDGSVRPEDQDQLEEILQSGWGASFRRRNFAAALPMVKEAGKPFEWLALMLEGLDQTDQAWQARGGGYANTVSDAGWKGFAVHLASARQALTKAWELRPELPQAATQMMYVSLGDSDLREMRLWFDRAVAGQIDYDPAWTQLRWGLRPRWYGDRDSMLAFGATAVKTRRFDTDVPRKVMDVVADLAAEAETPPGRNLYGREDIWPHLREMYDGYVAAETRPDERDGWRSAYATVAFLAGQYGAARTQLEALQWKPHPHNLTAWGVDLSLMPIEVAARTGTSGQMVTAAEEAYGSENLAKALQIYNQADSDARQDDRTKSFIRSRLASIRLEQQLQKPGWVGFLPQSDQDPNWRFAWGAPRRLKDGALEVQSGKLGHFFFSRAPVGRNFEVKGEFEFVRSSTRDFQAGLIMGMPDCDTQFESSEWYSFVVKTNATEGQVANFSAGWTRSNLHQKISLRDGANSFYFRLQDGTVTASVNGQTVFSGAPTPRDIRVAEGKFLLGLGAFNDVNETVVRYRGLQVQRIQ